MKSLLLVVRADAGAAIQSFVQLSQSAEGQAMLRRNGITPHVQRAR